MTTATAETPTEKPAKPKPDPRDDPEQYRMTIGEHLEELRTRLILALVGFIVAGGACMYFGSDVITFFCKPLLDAYNARRINPMLYFTEMGEPFMVWLRISLICGAAVASPWILYQLWQFVASGLYPHERRWVTKFIPFSVGLLITGMVFVYFVVLPLTLSFFLDFGITLKSPTPTVVATTQPIPRVPAFQGDPKGAEEYSFWYNELEHKLKMVIGGKVSVIQVLPEGMLAPHITLAKYIDLVVILLLVFGLSFQLPLVVMALVRIGIVDTGQLKAARKIVYFALLVLASAVSPGDVITVTVLMLVPLILLYELGIFLSKPPERVAEDEAAAP